MKNRKLPLIVAFFALATTIPVFGQNSQRTVSDFLSSTTAISKDISNREFVIANEDYSQSMKSTVVDIQQSYNGIPIFGNYSSLLISNDKVSNFSGNFTKSIASTKGTSQALSASVILGKVVQNKNFGNPSAYTNLLNEGKIREPKLVYFDNGQNLVLSYELEFEQQNSSNLWLIIADAKTGEVYSQQNLTLSCNFVDEPFKRHQHDAEGNHIAVSYPQFENQQKSNVPFLANNASYRVFEFPVEAPSFGSRTLASNPWDLAASQLGWQNDGTTEYNITRGNNVYAYTDETSTNTIGESADGGASHVFDFPMDVDAGLDAYKNAAITNLFYANNKIHDILYKFGFTETSKNFQQSNFGIGGIGNDYVQAEARDGAGVSDLTLNLYNNANFSTPSDGQKPRMQMYIWLGPQPYFFFNAPGSHAGTNIPQVGLGYFGTPLWKAPKTGDVVISPVLEACTALPAGSLAGKIGLAKRNNCSFATKVKNLQDAGAIAAIIYNSPDAATSPGEVVLNMSNDATITGITIPSVFVVQSKGEEITALIGANQNVNVTLKSTVFDGSVDNGVIAHEYGHGWSSRNTGTSVGCLNSTLDKEQMGEGWSDFLALMSTLRTTDNATTGRGIATYASGEDTNGGGIRPAQYSTDFAINDYTYGDTNGMEYTNAGGTLVPDVHSIGFVWASILWDLHWKYADKYGFNNIITADANSGSARVFQTVFNGIKVQGCYPTFVMGRDGIIAADDAMNDGLVNGNGDNKCLIWNVFAKRGVGVNASAGSKTNINDQVEDFTVPAECAMATSETNATKSISIYPNPAKNEFFLNIKGNILGKVNVEVYDASGKLVSSQKVDAKEAISTQNLANGVYFVKASGLGFEYSSKVIVKK